MKSADDTTLSDKQKVALLAVLCAIWPDLEGVVLTPIRKAEDSIPDTDSHYAYCESFSSGASPKGVCDLIEVITDCINLGLSTGKALDTTTPSSKNEIN